MNYIRAKITSFQQITINLTQRLNGPVLFAAYYGKKIASFFSERLRRWGPQIYRITTASKGISSFITAFNVSFKVMPVVLSILPLLSTVPILHYMVPTSSILTFMITPMIILISLIAGVASYKEAVERARLDKLTEENQRTLVALTEQIQELFTHNKQLTHQLEIMKVNATSVASPAIASLDFASKANPSP